MLDQATTQEPTIGEIHLAARERLANRHQDLLEKLIKENSKKEKYWILGGARTKRKSGRTIIRPSLKVYDVQPDVRKESYLYEVDNTAGTRTLVWVMHPNGRLDMPTIGKSIHAAGESGV